MFINSKSRLYWAHLRTKIISIDCPLIIVINHRQKNPTTLSATRVRISSAVIVKNRSDAKFNDVTFTFSADFCKLQYSTSVSLQRRNSCSPSLFVAEEEEESSLPQATLCWVADWRFVPILLLCSSFTFWCPIHATKEAFSFLFMLGTYGEPFFWYCILILITCKMLIKMSRYTNYPY